MSYNNKIHITWEDFYKDAKELSNKIKSQCNVSEIAGLVIVTRGGLALASVISSELNIKNIEIFSMFSYTDGDARNSELNIIDKPVKAIKDAGKNWLVVDDLLDTGRSAEVIKKYLPQSHFVTLYSKMKSNKNLDDYVKFFEPTSWICFPWSVYNF